MLTKRIAFGLIFCFVFMPMVSRAQSNRVIEFILERDSDNRPSAVRVSGLNPAEIDFVKKQQLDAGNTPLGLSVYVVSGGASKSDAPDLPSVAGSNHIQDGHLVFVPRYPFRAGMEYRATLSLELPDQPSHVREFVFSIPQSDLGPKPTVSAVYPTAKTVPSNHFRFYIHFSCPMSRGDAYQHVELLRDDGMVVPTPFLELGEELWDRSGTRFTLYLDPGRVKHALVPRQQLGAILDENRQYTLVIKPGWRDANGRPMEREYRHSFRVGPAQHDRIDPTQWKVSQPLIGSREPLQIEFPIVLDRALAERAITVFTKPGKEVDGKAVLLGDDRRWEFTPESSWSTAECVIKIDPVLEDTAGNNPLVPLEVDTTGSVRAPAVANTTADRPTLELPIQFRNTVATSANVSIWPQWRGPTSDGIADPKANPPIKWDKQTNIRWQADIPGEGSATPAVWGTRIFVLSALATGRKAEKVSTADANAKTQPPNLYYRYLVTCLNRDSGAVEWQQIATEQVPHEGKHQTHTYAASSPCTDGETLFASFASRGIYAYSMEGSLKWSVDLGDMRTRLGWGEAVTPVLAGDKLIVNWDQEQGSFIAALDKATGKTLWKVDRDEVTSWNTPLIVHSKGKTLAVVNSTNRVRAYDVETGKEVWTCGGQTVNAIPSPVPYKDSVICMSGYRGAAAVSIPIDSQGDVSNSPSLHWKLNQGTPYVPSPVLSGNRLIFTQANTDIMTCVDADTGKPLIERRRLSGVGSLYSSPIVAGGHIYFAGRDGTTVVLKNNENLDVASVNSLGDPIDASPIAIDDMLILRSWGKVYCIQSNK